MVNATPVTFITLRKEIMKKKTIAKLKHSNGTVTKDQFEILRNSNDAVSASAFFENITPLENTDQQMCEGKVSAEECLKP